MEKSKLTLIVGAFVALGSILIFAIIFLLGQERSLFEATTHLRISFEKVAGLKPGSPVQLAGMNIGTVRDIRFSTDLAEKKLNVDIEVRSSMMPRIRKDSTATVATKGLLGDKVVEISVGSQEVEGLKEGDLVISQEPPDMFQILERGGALISAGADVAQDLKSAVHRFADDKTIADAKQIVTHLEDILYEVKTGGGVLHGLIYDRGIQTDLKSAMSNLSQASSELNRTIEHMEGIVQEVRSGQGTLHGLIFDQDGKKIVDNVRRASESVAEIVDAVKTNKGMLHTLIYEERENNIIANLEEASADLRRIAKGLEDGQGTLGALIKDPTLFEDLKLILSNLKRNDALKGLIRMSLDRQDAAPKPPAKAKEK